MLPSNKHRTSRRVEIKKNFAASYQGNNGIYTAVLFNICYRQNAREGLQARTINPRLYHAKQGSD